MPVSSKTSKANDTNTTHNKIALVVLAGGQSQRMGVAKATLPFSPSETFLDHILAEYAEAGVRDAVVVLPSGYPSLVIHEGRISVRFAKNAHAGASRLDSLRRGLSELSSGWYAFIQDSDRPFVSSASLRKMRFALEPEGYVAPDIDGHAGHPFLLSPQMVLALLKDLGTSTPETTLRDMLLPYKRTLVTIADKGGEVNINTLNEYEEYFNSQWKE